MCSFQLALTLCHFSLHAFLEGFGFAVYYLTWKYLEQTQTCSNLACVTFSCSIFLRYECFQLSCLGLSGS